MQPEQQQRIMGYFIEEAKDHLNTIERGLLNLQSTIEDSEMVNEVFRAAHSVKGGAAMLGLNAIQHTSHRLEDYFKILKDTAGIRVDQRLESMLLRVFDTLQELLEQLQGPFGLTEEASNAAMAGIEPVFGEIDAYLGALSNDVPMPDSVPTVVGIARPLFNERVSADLREMLNLFKQADTVPDARTQLSALADRLRGHGHTEGLTVWVNLLDQVKAAIANPDNAYRTLAAVVIKELKQAQDWVKLDQPDSIAASEQLRNLLPMAASDPLPDLGAVSLDAGLADLDIASADLGDLDADLGLDLGDLDADLGDLDTALVNDDLTAELGDLDLGDLAADDLTADLGTADLGASAIDDDLSGLLADTPTTDTVEISDALDDLLVDDALNADAATASEASIDGLLDGLDADLSTPSDAAPSLAADDLSLGDDLGLSDDVLGADLDVSSGLGDDLGLDLLDQADSGATAASEDNEFRIELDEESTASLENLGELFMGVDESELTLVQDLESTASIDLAGIDIEPVDGPDLITQALDLDALDADADTPPADALSDADLGLDVLADLDDMPAADAAGGSAPEDAHQIADNQDEGGWLSGLAAGAAGVAAAGAAAVGLGALGDQESSPEELLDSSVTPDQSDMAQSFDALDLGDLDNADDSSGNLASDNLELGESDLAAIDDLGLEDDLNLSASDLGEIDLGDSSLEAVDFSLDAAASVDQSLPLESPDLTTNLDIESAAETDLSDLDLDSSSDVDADLDLGDLDLSLTDDATAADLDLSDLAAPELDMGGLDDGDLNAVADDLGDGVTELQLDDVSFDADGSIDALAIEDTAEPPALDQADVGDMSANDAAENSIDQSLDDLGDLDLDLSDDSAVQLDGLGADLGDLDLGDLGEVAAADDLDSANAPSLDAEIDTPSVDTTEFVSDDLDGVAGLNFGDNAPDDLAALDELASLDDMPTGDTALDGLDLGEASLDDSFDALTGLDANSADDFAGLESLTDLDDAPTGDVALDSLDLGEASVDDAVAGLDDLSVEAFDAGELNAEPAVVSQDLGGLDDLGDFSLDTPNVDVPMLDIPAASEVTDNLADGLAIADAADDLDLGDLDLGGLDEGGDASELSGLAEIDTATVVADLDLSDADLALDEPSLDAAPSDELSSLDEFDLGQLTSGDALADGALTGDDFAGLDDLSGDLDLAGGSDLSSDAADDSLVGLADLSLDDVSAPVGDNLANDDLANLVSDVPDTDSGFDLTSLGLGAAAAAGAGALGMAALNRDENDVVSNELGTDALETNELAADSFDDLDSLVDLEVGDASDGDLDALLGDVGDASTDMADLDALLDDAAPEQSEFSQLDALLDEPAASPAAVDDGLAALAADPEFDDLEKLLLDDTDTGSAPSPAAQRPAAKPATSRRSLRSGKGFSDQTMRVSVKHLDNLSNLVGELVVNRNSLEQDQERMRQSLDNLLYQVQQLSDVGQRMQDLYERSLLESSLLASRQNRSELPFPIVNEVQEAPDSEGSEDEVEYDPLEMDRFTGFHTLSQEMIELIVRVRESASDIEFIVDETDQVTRMFRQVTTQLQEGLTRSRMVPFAQTADRLPRAVRDIAMKVGKQAELVVEGRETLIDKMILEHLYDPMTHLVNNAITHGIEGPDARKGSGKSDVGRITIRAFHQGNQTVISVSDDGAGIDVDRVRMKAIEKSLITSAEAQTMSRLDLFDLIFHPGFTTRDQADDFAGRGVGMDVVRTSLTEIRGAVTIDSNPGKGTTFTIRLPLTLSISKALCCISDRARIAFPMDGVEDMLDLPKDRLHTDAEGQLCVPWRDTMLPLRPLTELLAHNRHMSRGNVYGGNQEDDIISVVVLRSAGNYLALQVDQVLGEQEIVIKQLEGPVPKPVGIAGATVLGDGRIMPIADVLELIDLSDGRLRRGSGSMWEQEGEQVPVEAAPVKTDPLVLIVDDSITVRELLSMTFNKVGYRVEQARDGQEAWEKLRAGLPCDIVFCDIEMPRMDGLELLSRVQKDPHLKKLPVAMLTSRGADRHRQMATSLGAKGYFTKPYLEEALLDAAARMLKGEVLIG